MIPKFIFKMKVSKKTFQSIQVGLLLAMVINMTISIYGHKIELAIWQLILTLVIFFYFNLNAAFSASFETIRDAYGQIGKLTTHNQQVDSMVENLSKAPIGIKGMMVLENDQHEIMKFDVIKVAQEKVPQKPLGTA